MLDGSVVRGWCADALDALGAAREEIDALNVYPVPDADTGTNLFLTMESAVEELAVRPDDGDLAGDLKALVHGALLGARGNSGVILSQLARGAAQGLLDAGGAGADPAQAVRSALEQACSFGYAAVAEPVEGTMLTVVREAAQAARSADGDGAGVARAAAAGAQDALERTPQMLGALARAGVVDAGGRGVVVLLEVLADAVQRQRVGVEGGRVRDGAPSVAAPVRGHGRPGGPVFEVMYLVETDDAGSARLKQTLAGLGESLLVVGGDGLWNVHVHVDDAGAAIEAGLAAGRPYRIRVTHFDEPAVRPGEGQGQAARAVLVVVPGSGLAELARACGATVVELDVGGRRASSDVIESVQRGHAAEVVLLPGGSGTVAAAEVAAEHARAGGMRAAVIPTRSPVQTLAALAVHDPGRGFDDDVVAMTAAAGATRHGAVTLATTEALTSAGVCRPGDVLGMVEDDVACIGGSVDQVAVQVLDRMLSAGGELVTAVLGAQADPQLARAIAQHLRHAHPEVELAVHHGGQDVPLLLGVE